MLHTEGACTAQPTLALRRLKNSKLIWGEKQEKHHGYFGYCKSSSSDRGAKPNGEWRRRAWVHHDRAATGVQVVANGRRAHVWSYGTFNWLPI